MITKNPGQFGYLDQIADLVEERGCIISDFESKELKRGGVKITVTCLLPKDPEGMEVNGKFDIIGKTRELAEAEIAKAVLSFSSLSFKHSDTEPPLPLPSAKPVVHKVDINLRLDSVHESVLERLNAFADKIGLSEKTECKPVADSFPQAKVMGFDINGSGPGFLSTLMVANESLTRLGLHAVQVQALNKMLDKFQDEAVLEQLTLGRYTQKREDVELAFQIDKGETLPGLKNFITIALNFMDNNDPTSQDEKTEAAPE